MKGEANSRLPPPGILLSTSNCTSSVTSYADRIFKSPLLSTFPKDPDMRYLAVFPIAFIIVVCARAAPIQNAQRQNGGASLGLPFLPLGNPLRGTGENTQPHKANLKGIREPFRVLRPRNFDWEHLLETIVKIASVGIFFRRDLEQTTEAPEVGKRLWARPRRRSFGEFLRSINMSLNFVEDWVDAIL
ncbi:hypothetical protein V8E36_006444 [Tilletia maclaganii]